MTDLKCEQSIFHILMLKSYQEDFFIYVFYIFFQNLKLDFRATGVRLPCRLVKAIKTKAD